jgi:TPR repeat protein
MSYRTPRPVAKGGLMPRQREERPPLILHFATLYKVDGLFRGLVDLMVVGLLVVGAKADWSKITAMLPSVPSPQAAGPSLSGTFTGLMRENAPGAVPFAQRLVHGPGFGDQIVNDLVQQVHVDEQELERSPEPLRTRLREVSQTLNALKNEESLAQVRLLDDKDPTVAYVKAIVLLRQLQHDPAEVYPLLRRATEKAVFPAYIVLGNALVNSVDAFEIGARTETSLVTVDDAGAVHRATVAQLLNEAALSYERAASFGRASGLRLYGLARARGWGGKRDLLGAAALWKQAASAGDPLSQHELGRLLQSGSGVQADAAEAERHYRATLESVPASSVALAALLLPKAIKGDEPSAIEAISLLENYAKVDRGYMHTDSITRQTIFVQDDFRLIAFWLHAKYDSVAAPPRLRDPVRALIYYESAAILGHAESAWEVGEGMRLGKGVPRDPSCAFGFYLAAREANPSKVDPILKELAEEIGPDGMKRGKKIFSTLRSWPSSDAANIPDTKGPYFCDYISNDPTKRSKTLNEVLGNLEKAARKHDIPLRDLLKP